MRAIIIDDKDAVGLLDRLKLEAFSDNNTLPGHSVEQNDAWQKLPKSLRDEIVKKIHGAFHYRVSVWLQEQGCNTVGR